MTPFGGQAEPSGTDLRRASDENAEWLRSRGVPLLDNESGEALVTLRDAIERFESVVELHGGDLMVDEPVKVGERPERPDSRLFALPTRGDDESLGAYTARVNAAADAANQGPWS
jgi:hypothetical protein